MPPVAPQSETHKGPPAAFVCLGKILNRSDFVATSRGRRAGSPGLNLQGRNRGDDAPPRVGFTATKKVGNAVARNRAKRRLRALAQQFLTGRAKPGWDYVLVARPTTTVEMPWDELKNNFLETLEKIHRSER